MLPLSLTHSFVSPALTQAICSLKNAHAKVSPQPHKAHNHARNTPSLLQIVDAVTARLGEPRARRLARAYDSTLQLMQASLVAEFAANVNAERRMIDSLISVGHKLLHWARTTLADVPGLEQPVYDEVLDYLLALAGVRYTIQEKIRIATHCVLQRDMTADAALEEYVAVTNCTAVCNRDE